MNEWRAFMTKWYPEGDQDDASTVFAYGVAKGIEQVLRQCGDDLTRENVMKQAANLNFEIGIYLPGTKIKTSPTDFAPLEQLQMMRFKGETWERVRAGDERREELVGHSLRSSWRAQVIGARQVHLEPSFAGAASFAGGASAFFFKSSAVFFCAVCRSSTIFCRPASALFSASICRLAASSFC